jgi:hypothetical protein
MLSRELVMLVAFVTTWKMSALVYWLDCSLFPESVLVLSFAGLLLD